MHTLAPARTSLVLLALVLGALALSACRQGGRTQAKSSTAQPAQAKSPAPKPDRAYYRGTPAVRQDIRDLFARVEGAAAHDWAAIAQKLVSYGEPGVPQMIANLGSHQTSVQLMAAYCLGMIQDPRALGELDAARVSASPGVRYEAATAMLRMGDRRGLPTMIDGLEDADPLVRGRAILVLKARTGNTMGYEAQGRTDDRQAAVARWRAWLARGGGVMAPRAMKGVGPRSASPGG
jgi:hypothetical protein